MIFFFSSRRRHTRSVSAFLLNRSSDLVRFQNGRSLNELNRGQSGLETYGLFSNLTHDFLLIDRKSGSAGMPRPISYAVFCLKKKRNNISDPVCQQSGLGYVDEVEQ